MFFFSDKEKIFLHGGKTKSGEILGDSFLFDPVTNTWEQVISFTHKKNC